MVTLNPTADTWVYEAAPNNIYGSLAQLGVLKHTSSGYDKYAYVKFDLSSQTIDLVSATLYLHVHAAASNDAIYIKRCTSSWDESTTNWNNKPTTTDSNLESISLPSIGWYNVDITNIIIDLINGTDYGIGLFEIVAGYDGLRISERTTANHMYLVITYEPHRYVKTTGDDSKDGSSWTNAWATINKAATTVADGTTVHIGHGTYNSEPAGNTIAPVNAGSTGIKYKPETADTGAEVAGSVTIEKN